MGIDLNPLEVAEFSGAPKRSVEKAIEEKILSPVRVRHGLHKRRTLPVYAVAYLAVVHKLKYRMDPVMKRRLVTWLSERKPRDLKAKRFELEPAVEVDIGRLVGDAMERAEKYGATRDRFIVEDEEILGGTPVVRGTRISVYAILGRIEDGETTDDILSDYPSLTAEAVEAAAIYARTHPPVGRPGGRPWASAA